MLDIKYVRENQEAVAEAMKNRHASWDAARFSQLDEAEAAKERGRATQAISAVWGTAVQIHT